MRRHRSRSPVKRVRPLAVELLEDRLPVSENFGTLLAVSALAGWADTLLESPRTREWAERGIDTAQSASGVASIVAPNGLTLTGNLSIVEARPHAVETAARPVAAFDSVFASLGDDLQIEADPLSFDSSAGPSEVPHGSDAGLQSPLIGAGTVLSSPMPAYASGGAASSQPPASYSWSNAAFPVAPTSADQQLTQAVRFAPAASVGTASGGSATPQTPVQRLSGPLIQGGQLLSPFPNSLSL
jgi:hypothetical protein